MNENVNILSSRFYDDQISESLIDDLSNWFNTHDENAVINFDYLLTGGLDAGNMNPDVLILSPKFGLIILDVYELSSNRGNSLEKEMEVLKHKEDLIFGNLIKYGVRELKNGRDVRINLMSRLYTPNLTDGGRIPDAVISVEEICKQIQEKGSIYDEMSDIQIDSIESVLDYFSGAIKSEPRVTSENLNSKAGELDIMEKKINRYDMNQRRAALSEINGPQRIRGLAGSGKTVILCFKVAAMHAKYPDRKILYTFMTKSLYDFAETLITRFYRVISDDGTTPDFQNKVKIMHAWGGRAYPGVYYDACRDNNIMPLTFNEVRNEKNPFNVACADLLDKANGHLNSKYDYVFIDEAQDFKPEFYQICRELTKKDRIVWAYDDLQNIYDVKLQNPMQTFANKYGAKGIDLAEEQRKFPGINNDVVLRKSYRNTKKVLMAAQAIGFGIYASHLVQTISSKKHWADLGYRVLQGDCSVGSEMIIDRPDDNSPLELLTNEDAIKITSCANANDEIEAVVNSIEKDVKEEYLRPEDISVISIDDRYAKRYFSKIESELLKRDIMVYNLLGENYLKGFIKKGCVTLSTVYKAKGNESGAIYIVGADAFEKQNENIKNRDRMFVAMTRARGWLKISGCNIEDGTLMKEFQKLKNHEFRFDFIQQDVQKIQRDFSREQAVSREISDYKEIVEKLKKLGVNPDTLKSGDEKND